MTRNCPHGYLVATCQSCRIVELEATIAGLRSDDNAKLELELESREDLRAFSLDAIRRGDVKPRLSGEVG
jgi:hypothetical protein